MKRMLAALSVLIGMFLPAMASGETKEDLAKWNRLAADIPTATAEVFPIAQRHRGHHAHNQFHYGYGPRAGNGRSAYYYSRGYPGYGYGTASGFRSSYYYPGNKGRSCQRGYYNSYRPNYAVPYGYNRSGVGLYIGF